MLAIPDWLYDENQPEYRKLRLLPFIVYSFFFSFTSSFAALWLFFEPFNFGSELLHFFCGKNIGKYTILILLSSFLSISYTLIRLYRYYYGLYIKIKDSNYFYNIYPNRTWLEDHFSEFLKNAKDSFFLVSISGNSFTSTPGIEEILEKKVTQSNNQCLIKILIHHENSIFIDVREQDENRNPGHIKRDCSENFKKWQQLSIKLSSPKFIVKRQNKFSIGSFCLQVDDVLYFEPYLAYNSGRHCPLFVIHKNASNERVYYSILNQMEKLLDSAED